VRTVDEVSLVVLEKYAGQRRSEVMVYSCKTRGTVRIVLTRMTDDWDRRLVL